MSEFTVDYFILAFFASIGVIQLAASVGDLDGLLFFKRPLLARAFGLILVVAPIVWFFVSDPRNVNDMDGGLDANTQAKAFFLACLAAVATTLILSSLVNLRMNRGKPSPGDGFDALRQTNYLRALSNSLGYWRRAWREQMKTYFFG